MSDTSAFSHTGTGPLPPPTSFEPSDENAVALGLRPDGTVVLLLAAGDGSAWAADAAIALASAWAQGGRRVVLADLHLENPSLHDRLGAANLEGMVDVFLYGASISRSARPVRGRGFYLISAGTYEADAEAIYRHPRWPKLVAGFREANASLVLFAPAEATDLESLARWVDRAVLLGSPASEAATVLLDQGVPVEARLVPPGAPAFDRPPEEPGASRSKRPVSPADEELPPRGVDRDGDPLLPSASAREVPRGSRRGWLVALAVLVGMAVLAWVGYLAAGDRPRLSNRLAPGAAPGEGAGAAASTRTGEALPFSVQVKAFSSFTAARQELLAQTGRYGGVLFFVSPEEVQGVLYFKIMAGLAADTAMANALQARLAEAGAIDPEDTAGAWNMIRPTPFAFDLGEFSSAGRAMLRADSLLAREVPSYAVAMPYSDGPRRWQLYGGAYPDSASAEAMRQRLRAAAVEPRLVLRVGESGAGGEAAMR